MKNFTSVTSGNQSALPDNGTVRTMLEDLIMQIASPILILLCLVGNTFCFILIAQVCHVKDLVLHFRVISIANMIAVLATMLEIWLMHTFNLVLRDLSGFWCKSQNVINYSSGDLAIWLKVAVTLDRFIVVWWPFQAKKLATKSTWPVVIFLCTLSIIKNCSLLISRGLTDKNGTLVCESVTFIEFDKHIRPIIALITVNLIPIFLVLVLTVAIIVALTKHGAELDKMEENIDPNKRRRTPSGLDQSKKNLKTTIILTLTMSIAFVVFTTPMFIVISYQEVSKVKKDHPKFFFLLKSIFQVLLMCHHSLDFYLYCIVSRVWRKGLLNLWYSCKEIWKRYWVALLTHFA